MNLNSIQLGSIKTRVTLYAIAIFVIGIWALAYYSSRMLHEDMQSLVGDQQFSTATLLATEINLGLESRLEALQIVAGEITPAMFGNKAALQRLLERNSVFERLFNGGVIALGLDGTAIADVPVTTGRIGLNYIDSDFAVSALKEGKATFSRPAIDTKLRAPVFRIAAPIRDSHGKVIGALAGVTNLQKNNFLDNITQGIYGKTGYYLLVAPQYRQIITATNKNLIMAMFPASGISPVIDRFNHGYEGSAILFTTLIGKEVLASVKGIPVAGWHVSVSLPTDEAFAPILELRHRILLAAIFLTLIAGILIWWTLRHQLSPMFVAIKTLGTLADASQEPPSLEINRQDEIGELIGGFNRLLKTLWQRKIALQESEERYRTLVEWSPVAIAVHRGGKVLYANPAAIKMLGAGSEKELLGKCIFDLTHLDCPQIVKERIRSITADDVAVPSNEEKFIKLDGTVIEVEVHATSIVYDGDLAIQAFLQDITERKQTEIALKESEERFRMLFRTAGDGLHILDVHGNLLQASDSFCRMLGYSQDEIISMNVLQWDALLPSGTRFEEKVNSIPEEGLMLETRHRCKDGHVIDVELNCTTVSIKGERFVYTSSRDITESKRAKLELKKESEKNRAILRNASDGIHILDADGNIIEVSDSFCSMLGYRREEMIGMNVSQWDGELPYGERIKVIRRRIAQKSRNQFETRHRREDGTIFDVEISSFPLELDGKPVLFCSSRDISERKENELIQRQLSEQLRQYTDTISDLYDHAPCGYHSLDKDGAFLHINETELNWLGYLRYEIIGKRRLIDLLTPDSIPIFQQTFPHFKEVGEEHDLELSLARKDGTILPVLISSSAVYDADGTYIMGRSTVYDMTERIKMEQERIDYLKRMEEASRHLVTTQENTRRYLSSELHDRTSPNLAAMSINLDIIVAELTQEHLEHLASRLEDTRALIADTAASIREFVTDLRPPLLDYAGLVAALESYLQQFARRTGIATQFDCTNCEERFTPELESLLFRIVQEALTNCAKHSHAKSARVTLSDGNQPIRLTITDDGVGFDSSQLGRGVRIGLGLLNMRELAEVAGGKISIDSAPGKGTCIAVEISTH